MYGGTKAKLKYITIPDIHKEPRNISRYLPAYHALKGCDTINQFAGRGKNNTWLVLLDCHSLLMNLGRGDLDEKTIADIEQLVQCL